jgi:hypothetical protein
MLVVSLIEAIMLRSSPIPKIPRVVGPKDFFPISLVGSIYKIIAKTLVNMLKVVLEKIISKS